MSASAVEMPSESRLDSLSVTSSLSLSLLPFRLTVTKILDDRSMTLLPLVNHRSVVSPGSRELLPKRSSEDLTGCLRPLVCEAKCVCVCVYVRECVP